MAQIIHCILNNLVYEQRLHKIASTLLREHTVEVVGIIHPRTARAIGNRGYPTKRLWVPIGKGPLFFLLANLRLFLYLLFRKKWDAVIACDLDSLPACWLAARLRRKKLLLDSRELYTQTPFLAHRPVKRWVWEQVERFLYPRVPYILAVSPPIAAYFEQKYHKPVWVIYNLPLRGKGFVKPRLENRLLLYQGMLHPYRGLEELVLALSYAPGWKLWIVGDGPIRTYLEKLVRQQKVEDQVRFLGLVPFEAVVGYTQQATLGVSAELPHALNHRYALPNKAFDYIQQGIPLLVGEAPLLQALVRRYGCGFIVSDWRPKEIAYALREIGNAPAEYQRWVEASRAAAKELNWERQESCLLSWVEHALERKKLPPQQAVKSCQEVYSLHGIYEEVLREKGKAGSS